MKRPGRGSSSTALLTAGKTSGASCHSSSNRGSFRRRRAASGSALNTADSAGRSRRTTSAACCLAVVVLPTARGPLMSTAGKSRRSLARRISARRVRYACVSTSSLPVSPRLYYQSGPIVAPCLDQESNQVLPGAPPELIGLREASRIPLAENDDPA
jgi:hypothetical protein